jgi:hypothetical protein
MLVCNVSQLRRRAAIAVDLAETTTALDTSGTGYMVFDALVDDPASARELVDAFRGEIMREAANAAATVTAGLVYATNVVAATNATETVDAHLTYLVAVSEPASAVDAPSASITAATVYTVAIVEAASASDLVDYAVTAGSRFEGVLGLDGLLKPNNPAPSVIYIDGVS